MEYVLIHSEGDLAILKGLAKSSRLSKDAAQNMEKEQFDSWTKRRLDPEAVKGLLSDAPGGMLVFTDEMKNTMMAYKKHLQAKKVTWYTPVKKLTVEHPGRNIHK